MARDLRLSPLHLITKEFSGSVGEHLKVMNNKFKHKIVDNDIELEE